MVVATKMRAGNIKVTREDWLKASRDVLVLQGEEQIKVLPLANRLGVARSSFYWYFESREDLLDALLSEWESRNTRCILEKCAEDARNITEAICHFFECFLHPGLFDPGLDFAIREWARRDQSIRQKIDRADALRMAALNQLFQRFGFPPEEAEVRARIIYFMQLGYHALGVSESLEERIKRTEAYILGFTGEAADPEMVLEFKTRSERF